MSLSPRETEETTLPRLSFAEAKDRLKGTIDLDAALDDNLQLLVLSGRLAPEEREAHEARLQQTATISASGLAAALQLNRPLVPLFRTEPLTPAQAFSRLGESGVQTYDWTSGIAGYCPIDPSTQQPPTPSGTGGQQPPRLLLTPDDQEVSADMIGKKSPNAFLADLPGMAQNGTSFLDHQGWIDFFLLHAHRGLQTLKQDELAHVQDPAAYRTLLKATLLEERDGAFPIDQYLPDVRQSTLFPDVRNSAGVVLEFYWDPDRGYRSVYALDWSPSRPLGFSAPRLLFG